jgi:hypothetical protein
MPDYGFNYNLGPQAKQTNLADMLNFANTAQQFQQAQQINPLLLRQQQLATQEAESLTPERITTGRVKLQEEAKREPIATREKDFEYKKKQGALATQILTGALRDPSIATAAQNPNSAREVLQNLNQLMINQGVDPEAAKAHIDPLMNVLDTHPEKLAGILNYINTAAISSSEQAASRRPQLTTTAGGAPATYTAESGTIGVPTIQGQPQMQPSQPVAQPTAPQELPKVGGVSLSYPIRKAGDLRPLDPSEEADKKNQQAHRQSLLERQRGLTSAERISDEVIKTAEKLEKEAFFSKGGVAGNIERKLRMFAESETYDALAKDLANQALANAKVLGTSDTVGGLSMAEAATGSIKVPPDVLIQIARRNKANQIDIDLQAKAKNSFAQQFGDNNGATFDQIWRNNSDSKLFEAMSIEKSKMPYKEKQNAYKKLFEGLSPEDLADFKNKKANIDAMVNGNFAGVK